MLTNDQLILDEYLLQRKNEIAPTLDDYKFFELFVSEQILKDIDLSWEELEDGIIGASGDGGIDSMYVFINGVLVQEDTEAAEFKDKIEFDLYFIQAKQSNGFTENAIHKFRSSMGDLLDLSADIRALIRIYNQELLNRIERFRILYRKLASRLPKLNIHFYYATKGVEVHPNLERLVDSLKQSINDLFSDAKVTFDFIVARRLLELARKQSRTAFHLEYVDAIPNKKSYVCLVNLCEYHKFITLENGNVNKMIFDANVRDYQGDVAVNMGIRDSLRTNNKEDFWWLNNGVTIVSTNATSSGKTLSIENPQVVNGLQTSMEIYKYFKENPDVAEIRCVLVRVLSPEDEEGFERIICATNSQTQIPPASLKATDKIHRDIEDFLKVQGWYYERRKNYYKNERKPLEKIISISYMSQSIMAVLLGRPNDARARPSTLLKRQEDYDKVFSAKYPLALYLISVQILNRCADYLKSIGKSPKDIINLKYHLAYFSVRILLGSLKPTSLQIANLDLNKFTDQLLEDSLKKVQAIYDESGGNDQASKSKEMVGALISQLESLLQ